VTVKSVIKDASEWDEFVDSTCRTYGFENSHCPIIYTLEGKLIGNGQAFQEHVKEKFDKALSVPKETQKARSKLESDQNDEKMRKKREGDTMAEKIDNVLEKLKNKGVTNLIGDCFYTLKFEAGIPFHVRKTNLLRDVK